MIVKDIEIDGKNVKFRASATVPRLYRRFFNRDIFTDMQKLADQQEKAEKNNEKFKIEDLEMFENVAFVMAKHADPKQPDNPDEWLEQFDTFSIYVVLPQILELWCLQIGLSIADCDDVTIGLVNDMYAEKMNDEYDWPIKAQQDDFDRF